MRYAIPGLAILLFFSSCSDNSKSESSLNVFRASFYGLEQSVEIISISNKAIYRSLEDRLADPESITATMIWQPKALAIRSLTENTIAYIRQLKEELKSEAGFINSLDRISFKEDNVTAVDRYFNEHGKGKALFGHLTKYKQDVLAIDSELNNKLKNNTPIFAGGFDESKDGAEEFTKIFFGKIPAIAAMAMLSRFENNVTVTENKFITYCHGKTFTIRCGAYDKILPAVMQSSSCVKGGEIIEITTGIGIFTNRANPQIIVNGNPVPVEYGVANYKLKTSLTPGKHNVPVKIDYTMPDGTTRSMTRNIEYMVIEEK